MKKSISKFLIIFLWVLTTNFFCQNEKGKTEMKKSDNSFIQLPQPVLKSDTSIEEALFKRRSIRDYKNAALSIEEISQLLWSAQGITDERYQLRTSPSAGALFPLEVYLVVSNVKEIAAGIYKYNPHKHNLYKILEGDRRREISNSALQQEAIENSAAMILITAIYERTSLKYGKRAERYVHMEVGHAGQNIYLQAVSLSLGTVMIGAFNDDAMKKVFNLSKDEFPLALYPIGRI